MLLKWFFTICTLTLMCPRKIRLVFIKYGSIRSGLGIDFDKSLLKGFSFDTPEMIKLKIWPNGQVPYYIDDFSFDKVLRDRIRIFLEGVNGFNSIEFLELPAPPSDDNVRWVFFINRRGQLGCADHTTEDFTNEGVQKVVLGYDCLTSDNGLAEAILAVLGVPPQHRAPDRENYITIQLDNVIPGKKYLFKSLQNNEWLFHDLPYDFASAGHFNWHKHTVNGAATIVPKEPVNFTVGEDNSFSSVDIVKIKMLYSYISTKKDLYAPECFQLFEAGSNFSSYQLNSKSDDDTVLPLNKPSNYLNTKGNTIQVDEGHGVVQTLKGSVHVEGRSKAKDTTVNNNVNKNIRFPVNPSVKITVNKKSITTKKYKQPTIRGRVQNKRKLKRMFSTFNYY